VDLTRSAWHERPSTLPHSTLARPPQHRPKPTIRQVQGTPRQGRADARYEQACAPVEKRPVRGIGKGPCPAR